MPDDNVALVRSAYEAYQRGDAAAVLELVDADFEWTYLDPAFEDSEPQTCHGREQLATALGRVGRRGLRPQLEEVAGRGDKVMVVIYTPGLDEMRARKADDRNFDVLTIKHGRIVAMRACKDRSEAASFAGLS